MLKRGTILLLTGAIVLGGAVLLFESRQGTSDSAVTGSNAPQNADTILAAEGDGELMFPFEEGDVSGVTVARPDETLAFEKEDANSWRMTQPEESEAESGAIAFLLNQLTSPTLRKLSVESSTLADFGLAEPGTTVTLSVAGTRYPIAIGTADFTGDKLYVQLISTDANSESADTTTVYVVSGGLQNAVTRPTADWLISSEEPASEDANEEDANEEDANEETSEESTPETTSDPSDQPPDDQ